jgi:hypothetical protein
LTTLLLCLALPVQETALDRLLRAADVGTDKKFEAVLEKDKQRVEHSAPVRLRELLAGFRLLRMEMGQAFMHDGTHASLVWWFGEIGVAGDRDTVEKSLRMELARSRFTVEEGDSKTGARFEKDGVAQRIEIDGPTAWSGGRETACGFRLKWTVTEQEKSAPPALKAVIARMPILKDSRVEENLLSLLEGFPVAWVGSGGTWTRYYDWDVSLYDAKEELPARLEKWLADQGYARSEKGREYDTYERRKTGSFGRLYPRDDKKRVRIRLQPES